MIFILLFGGIIFVIDQVTKIIMLSNISPYKSVTIIPHVLDFTLVKNTGIAFGLLKNHSTIAHCLVLIGCVLLVGVLRNLHSNSRANKLACAFMIGGALGNLVDRIRFGAVIDFIDFKIWPVFNLADTFISIAAGLFIILLFRKT
ncbi:MAG: signal peptidase II [Candidatus Omnitrophica bacterium]|nr:signal peptidase II [Candidatus Omnitrophota bacterium]